MVDFVLQTIWINFVLPTTVGGDAYVILVALYAV
jgi:hypothetical protein